MVSRHDPWISPEQRELCSKLAGEIVGRARGLIDLFGVEKPEDADRGQWLREYEDEMIKVRWSGPVRIPAPADSATTKLLVFGRKKWSDPVVWLFDYAPATLECDTARAEKILEHLRAQPDCWQLHWDLWSLRSLMDRAFSPDTAVPGTGPSKRSAGHCAVAAALVQESFGGKLVSATVAGASHWFNRLELGGREFDADLTPDQFSDAPFEACDHYAAPLQCATAGALYKETRVRDRSELNVETQARLAVFRERVAKAGADRREAVRLIEEGRRVGQ